MGLPHIFDDGPQTRPLKVLIVDDDPLAMFMTSSMAEMAIPGMAIQTAACAQDAFDLFAADRFDCVLIDYEMPGANGLELASRIHALDPAVPILLCTGAGNETLAADAIKQGVSDYLPKATLSADGLRRAIRDAIDKARQAHLIAAQRKDIEMFAFALAHDFKQPSRHLVTFAELARQEAPVADGSQLDQMLQFISAAAGRLNRLVDGMMEFMLLSAPPPLRPVEVDAIFAGICLALQDFLQERGGVLDLVGSARVMGHEALLGQVLQNIAINGLTYNESALPRVEIACAKVAAGIEIRVCDNGIGIDACDVDRIFEPLVRLNGREAHDGSGIGLTLARRAMAAMQGTIRCEPRPPPDRGTVFVLMLGDAAANSDLAA